MRRLPLLLLLTGCGPSVPPGGHPDFATDRPDGSSNPFDLAGCPGPTCDEDGDGYSPAQGDCDDTDPLVNPGAFEVPGNGVDDNCNGLKDEPVARCSESDGSDAMTLAGAIGLCSPWLLTATMNNDADPAARASRANFGLYTPKDGTRVALLATGVAADENQLGYVQPQPGTSFQNDDSNPVMGTSPSQCGQPMPDSAVVHDYVELKLQLKVPTNAKSFSFNFMFVSSEYPEFVGRAYNDKFLALLDSKAFSGNVSFDRNGSPITVNTAFFQVCDTELICQGQKQNTCMQNANALGGTGYELDDGTGLRIGGGTGWLTTYAPVTPGETATLRFVIYDDYDHLWDSAVIIDNFQWQLTPAMMPMTIG